MVRVVNIQESEATTRAVDGGGGADEDCHGDDHQDGDRRHGEEHASAALQGVGVDGAAEIAGEEAEGQAEADADEASRVRPRFSVFGVPRTSVVGGLGAPSNPVPRT